MVKFLKNALKKFKKLPIILKVVLFLGMFFLVRVGLDALLWGDRSNYENKKEKDQEGMGNGKKMYLFHWKNCGHCKKMKPDWENAAKQVNVNGEKKMVMVDLGDKDDLAQEQLRKDYNIRGYPTIVDLEGGKQVGEYSGDRSVSAFVSHVNNM